MTQKEQIGESGNNNMVPLPEWVVSGTAATLAGLYCHHTEFVQKSLYLGFLGDLWSNVAGKLMLKSELPATLRLDVIFPDESGCGRKSLPIDTNGDFFKMSLSFAFERTADRCQYWAGFT